MTFFKVSPSRLLKTACLELRVIILKNNQFHRQLKFKIPPFGR